MDDEKFVEMISEEKSEILAVKFNSCQMEAIPSTVFEKFPTLLCLMTTSPGLSVIQEEIFSNASNLQFLYLPGNRITRLESNSFLGASNLNEINLTDNEIEFVSGEAFHGLQHLESLSLCRNKIEGFHVDTFAPLTELVNLDISGNQIKYLMSILFTNNLQLSGINIADNQIHLVSDGFLEQLPQIKVLNMMNNPCTNNTMLQNIPLIKIIESTDGDDDEDLLKSCYQNYIKFDDLASDLSEESEFEEKDNPLTDINDLLAEAETVREDIESNIISELTQELRDKDIEIEMLESREDILKLLLVLLFILVSFFAAIKIIARVVNSVYQKQLQKKSVNVVEVETVIVDPKPKQIIFTIPTIPYKSMA